MKCIKGKIIFVMVVIAVVAFATSGLASDDKPTATVSIESKAVALGVGVQWGSGVLKFKGKEYHFKVNGISVVDIGITTISATGDVYHLEKMEDFPGTFKSAEAGIAVGGGAGAVAMKNQNGVVMKLTSTKAGVQLKLAPEGIKIEMK